MLTLPLKLWAANPQLSYYVFENHGKASNGSLEIKHENTVIPINQPWFEWTCKVQKQEDGVLLNCQRGADFVETKIYCQLPEAKAGRLVRVGKDSSFVTFEAHCEPPKKTSKKKPKA